MTAYKPDFSVKRMRIYPALSESQASAQGHQVKSDWFARRTLPIMGRGGDKLFFSSSVGGGITNITDQPFFNASIVGKVQVSSNLIFSGSRDDSLLAGFSADDGVLQTRFSYDYTGATWGLTDTDPFSGKPWWDKPKFNAVEYITNTSSLQYPVVNDDPSAIDILDYNGVIEPLTMRSVIGMSSTFMGDTLDPEPHSIRAGIGGSYVEEQYNRFNLCTNFYKISDSNKNYPFSYVVDWHIYEGFSFAVPDSTYTFDDNLNDGPQFIEKTLPEIIFSNVRDPLIRSYLMHQSTSGSMDDRPSKDSISKPCGFIYENCSFGTDSLAFGGLLK